jgi:uncharacterized protein
MKNLDLIVKLLLVIGGLNWALVAFFNTDIVQSLFDSPGAERFCYILFGLSGLYALINWNRYKGSW